jgi:transposase InsO family protein
MERRGLVSKDNRLSLQTQCNLPEISKSGLCYLQKGESDENLEMDKGFMYLTAIIDAYSRFIVGRGLSSLYGKT